MLSPLPQVPGVPEIKVADGLTATQLDWALVISSVGAILGFQLAGRSCGEVVFAFILKKVCKSGTVLVNH